MKSWDTNFLIRHVMADDEQQFAKVQDCLEEIEASGEAVYLPQIVLAESFWVLRSAYGLKSGESAKVLLEIALDDRFLVENEPGFIAAAEHVVHSKGDLWDQLILQAAKRANALPLYSFDKGLRRTEGVEVV